MTYVLPTWAAVERGLLMTSLASDIRWRLYYRLLLTIVFRQQRDNVNMLTSLTPAKQRQRSPPRATNRLRWRHTYRFNSHNPTDGVCTVQLLEDSQRWRRCWRGFVCVSPAFYCSRPPHEVLCRETTFTLTRISGHTGDIWCWTPANWSTETPT